MAERRTILFFVTEDWYLCSHRLPLVRAAIANGHRAVVVTRVRNHGPLIEATGAELIPLELNRRSRNPWGEFKTLRELVGIYKRVKPDLCHHVAMKPVLYGSLAARLAGVSAVVNALGGLGFIFISQTISSRLLRQPVKAAFRLLLVGDRRRLIIQNRDDMALLQRYVGIPPETFVLIPGSGVDLDDWPVYPEPEGPVRIGVVARMLWDKGIGEMVDASRLLRDSGHALEVTLVGPPDPENPASIPQATLDDWEHEGLVTCTGREEDIASVWRDHHISVLPSYREGLPKSLLESAACGRPMIATDVPGCRDVVRPGETGLLVPSHDPTALAEAIATLANDGETRRAMGARAREMVREEYTIDEVVRRTVAIYRDLLGEARR